MSRFRIHPIGPTMSCQKGGLMYTFWESLGPLKGLHKSVPTEGPLVEDFRGEGHEEGF